MQSSVGVPEEVKGLNWGAFLLNWIWAIGNQVWIGLLCLIPCINIFVAVYLLIKGNELAWSGPRQWESVQQFHEVQKKWAVAGLIVLGISIGLNILMTVLGVGASLVGGGAAGAPSP